MNILVTGSEGFIGRHLVKLLEDNNHTVIGYDIVNGENILSFDQLLVKCISNDVEYIVHLAGQVFLGPAMKNPRYDAETNILGTINVLEVARRIKANVTYSSSGAVYGSNDRTRISEDNQADPCSPYGLSKLSAEKYVLLYNKLYGMRNVVYRFSSVYGVGRKKTSVNLILSKALKQLIVDPLNPEFEVITLTGDGSQTRDFTHVSDIAEALMMSISGKIPAGIYNIGTGTSTSLNGLVKIVEDLLGQMLIINYIPKVLGDPLKNDFNVDKIEALGFKAKTDLKCGLRELLEVLKK